MVMMSSSMDQIFSETVDHIDVVGINHSHIAVQMYNYGYTLVKGKPSGRTREYSVVDHVDQLRGVSGARVVVLDGTQHCACRRQRYCEILEFVAALPHRYTLEMWPEIDSYRKIVRR